MSQPSPTHIVRRPSSARPSPNRVAAVAPAAPAAPTAHATETSTNVGFRWQKGVAHVGAFYLVEGANRFEYTSAPGRHGLLLPTGTEEAWTEACHIIKNRLLVQAHDLMKENRENFCWAKWEDSLTFEKTAESINGDLAPSINIELVPLGFRVDAGTATITQQENKKRRLFGSNSPKNVIFVRITRLSLRRAHHGMVSPRLHKPPLSPQKKNQDPRAKLYYPAPQDKFIRKSPIKKRQKVQTTGLASPRGNTKIQIAREWNQKQPPGSPLSRKVGLYHPPLTSPFNSPANSPGQRRQNGELSPSKASKTTISAQVKSNEAASKTKFGFPKVPDLNGNEPTKPKQNGTNKALDSSSPDLSKIVTLVADVMADIISENSVKLDSSSNSLTLDGVFDASPESSPKSKKTSCRKKKVSKSSSALGDSDSSLEDEVRSALLVALNSSMKKVDSSSSQKSIITASPKTGDTKHENYSKRLSALKSGMKTPSSKPKNQKKIEGSGKSSKTKKDRTKKKKPAYKDNSHLERMSESHDIHFMSSELEEEEEWTETERTLELSFSSLGLEADTGAPGESVARRSHAV